MTEWEHINNTRSHSHLSYFHSRPIHISLSNLAPIPMRILWEGWEAFSILMYISNASHFVALKENFSEGTISMEYVSRNAIIMRCHHIV